MGNKNPAQIVGGHEFGTRGQATFWVSSELNYEGIDTSEDWDFGKLMYEGIMNILMLSFLKIKLRFDYDKDVYSDNQCLK